MPLLGAFIAKAATLKTRAATRGKTAVAAAAVRQASMTAAASAAA